MSGVQQSGDVTPGHSTIWTTDGVIADGGAAPAAQRVLASLRGANFNVVTDQPIAIPLRFSAFQLTSIIITNASVSLSAASGGFYPSASKAGTPIVSAAQAYSTLTTADKLLAATLSSFGQTTRFSQTTLNAIGGLLNIWFSLSVGQGVAATADIYLCGMDLS